MYDVGYLTDKHRWDKINGYFNYLLVNGTNVDLITLF